MKEKRYQVFVSSTYEDLKEERQEVLYTLLQRKCIPTGMELFPPVDERQWNYIERIIEDCDYVVLIVAGRYGTVDDAGLSYTEKEFDYAVSSSSSIEAMPADKRETDSTLVKKLDRFRKKVSKNRQAPRWSEAAEIPILLSEGLNEVLGRDGARGWIRDPGPYAVPDREANERIGELVSSELVRSVDVLAHSNTTRQGIISAAVEDLKKPVRLLMQRPRHILKPRQRSQIGASVHDALTALEETGLFELRFHKNHASLRLTLLRGEDRQAVAAVVGWYLYREEDRVVPGARNPSVYALEADNPLVAWAAEEFQTKWSSAEEVTLANHHRLLQREEDAAR